MMKKKNFSISEAFVIAASPALIYLFVYAFERGYCSYFNLPYSIISIDISNLMVVGSVISGTLFTLFLIFSALPARGTRIIYRAMLFPSIFGYAAYAVIKSDAHIGIKIFFIIPFLLFFSSELIIPLFKYNGSWIDRWEKGIEISDQNETPVIQNSIVGRMIRQLINEGFNAKWIPRIYWIIFGGLLISYYSGMIYGKTQIEFIVEKNNPNVIYLRKWGDHLVGMKFDKDKNKLLNEINLLPIKSEESFKFENIRVDNLTPFDTQTLNKSGTKKIEIDSTLNKN